LIADWSSEREKGAEAINVWASQHLNIEIGIGISNDGWRGADFGKRPATNLDARGAARALRGGDDGIDGGGLDDLLGFAVVGRERETRRWLVLVLCLGQIRSCSSVRKEIAGRA
jgi:phage terminase large subunit-like protein